MSAIGLAMATAVLVGAAGSSRRPGAQEPERTPLEHFKYASVGIEDEEGIPYWIWQTMPIICADKLPGQGYASLGIHSEPGRELPVGFSKKALFGGERIAINCAFCHTTRVRLHPDDPPRLVPGGPSNVTSVQAYDRFLQSCAADPRFTADNVLAAAAKLTSLGWTDRLAYRLLLVPATRHALARRRDEMSWTESRPLWGPGRIDPFNPVKFRMLKLPVDETIGNADMVPVWNMRARKGMSLHWDGLSNSLREVVLSSALGDGASPKSLDFESLAKVEAWLESTTPPAWPYPVDSTLAARGREIYAARCASCHEPGGARTGTVIPLDEVGTDRHRLDMWTEQAATTYNAFADGYEWDFRGFRKTDGYVATPLDGLWLRAPFLHNGSVPTLVDLLEPADRRPRVFYRGIDLYDPDRVGFVADGPEAQRTGFRFDTAEPGNGNGGHTWGVDLPADEKRALVEFLKTL